MQNHKLLALVVGALTALGGASVFLLGNAQAATWHSYDGDLFPGHAYGLQVPDGAEAYEVSLDGDLGATAALALYDPAGALLGFHALDASTPAVQIEDPAEGRHVIYVYDVTDGALTLRVDALLAPVTTSLQAMPLYKEEIQLTTSKGAGALDLEEKADLASTPAFLTLLYEGSVKALDATVASATGDVVTISGESGTAFSPGVWSTLTGERASDPSKIGGLAYTVTATAERFEGTLTLVSVTIDHKAPAAPDAPQPVAAPVVPVNGAFTAPEGKAIAFTATKGTIRVTDLEDVVEKENDREYDGRYWHGALSIHNPDDSLLAYVTLGDHDGNVTITLPTDGEYVVFVHEASSDGLLIQLLGTTSMTGIRELPLAKEEFTLKLGSGVREAGETFELVNAPVAMQAALSKDTIGAFSWIGIANEKGQVAGATTLARAPGVDLFDWSHQEPENFAKGTHTLRVNGVVEGELHLTSLYYQRAAAAVVPAAEAPAAPADAETLLGLL